MSTSIFIILSEDTGYSSCIQHSFTISPKLKEPSSVHSQLLSTSQFTKFSVKTIPYG